MLIAWILAAAVPAAGADAPAIPLSLGSCGLLAAPPGEVRSLYWELYKHTEVCVTLVPPPTDGKPSPFVLTFSFTHTGQDPKPAPWILFRVQLVPNSPTVVLVPSLDVSLDGADPMHLAAPGQPYQLAYPSGCAASDGCSFNGVEVPLTPATFRRLAEARDVRGSAFGIPFALGPAPRASLLELARRGAVP